MSKVYFTDFRTTQDYNLLDKLDRLITEAGIDDIAFDRKFTAIKLHFGEPGNLAFLRPNFSRVIADHVKKQGGMPFLTDCNTLYVGRRKHALEHIDAAYENGFSPYSTGCQIIIADGLKGTDEIYVPVDGKHVKEAKIGRAIMDADIFISLNHFKGHEAAGFGGAIKNIGMGCGSRAGKMEMHKAGKPNVDRDLCVACGACYRNCAHSAISFIDKKAYIDHEKCVGCGRCIGSCNYDAISNTEDASNTILSEKMAEYAYAVVSNRPQFHISLIMDVSPYCDCHSENDAPIVADIGMLASFDPVALDQACADLVNQAQALPNSMLAESHIHEGDHFRSLFPETDWDACLARGEEMGLGQRDYELITLEW